NFHDKLNKRVSSSLMVDQSAYGYELDIFLIEMSFGSVGAPAPAIDSDIYRNFKSYHRGRGCHSSQLLLVLMEFVDMRGISD
ncbi:hypothetical protein V1478_008327, partial [Vespula squamosa]